MPYGSEESGAQIKTIGQEKQHTEQGNEQAQAAEYCKLSLAIQFQRQLRMPAKVLERALSLQVSPPAVEKQGNHSSLT
jgi:hypothetical protein